MHGRTHMKQRQAEFPLKVLQAYNRQSKTTSTITSKSFRNFRRHFLKINFWYNVRFLTSTVTCVVKWRQLLTHLLPLRWIGASSCSHQKRHCCHWEEWSHGAQPDQGTMLAILVQRYHRQTTFILCMWDIIFNYVTTTRWSLKCLPFYLPLDRNWPMKICMKVKLRTSLHWSAVCYIRIPS